MDDLATRAAIIAQIEKAFGPQRGLLTFKEIAEFGGPKAAKLYEDRRAGRLRVIKVGSNTKVHVNDFADYLMQPTGPPKRPRKRNGR